MKKLAVIVGKTFAQQQKEIIFAPLSGA